MTFSFSRLNSFENCKYEWYLNYLLLDENGKHIYDKEQNFYAAFGKFCHGILEKILRDKMTIEESADYYQDNFDEQIECWDVSDTIRDKYFYLGLDYFSVLDFEWLKKYEILGVEKKVVFEIADTHFVGFIDLLIREKDTGDIIVIDHKSSEYPIGKKGNVLKKHQDSYEAYKRQLYLYSIAVFNEYGKYPKELWWNYFKEQQWLKLPFIHSEYDNSIEWVKDTLLQIKNEEDYEPTEDYFYCNNLCGFRNSCDYKLLREDDE